MDIRDRVNSTINIKRTQSLQSKILRTMVDAPSYARSNIFPDFPTVSRVASSFRSSSRLRPDPLVKLKPAEASRPPPRVISVTYDIDRMALVCNFLAKFCTTFAFPCFPILLARIFFSSCQHKLKQKKETVTKNTVYFSLYLNIKFFLFF